jgi:hypothetical protein
MNAEQWRVVADLYKLALTLIGKIVEKARHSNDFGALLGGIEDVLDVINTERMDPELAAHALADLRKFDEALSGNDAAADRALREKFGSVDPVAKEDE